MRTIVIVADEVAPGMTLNYPIWRHPRPAGAAGNVNPEPMRVEAVDDRYPDTRVLWFDQRPRTSAAVVNRTARLELVVPEVDEHLVDILAELEAAVAERAAEPAELERAAMRLAKLRGKIIERANRPPAVSR